MYGFFEVNLLEHKMIPITPEIIVSFFPGSYDCQMSYAQAYYKIVVC